MAAISEGEMAASFEEHPSRSVNLSRMRIGFCMRRSCAWLCLQEV